MDNVAKFLALFSEFDLVVERKEITTPKKTAIAVRAETAGVAKSELEKELKRLMAEYKRAQKSFKANKLSRQDLFDFEWRIFELQEEIRRIQEDDLT